MASSTQRGKLTVGHGPMFSGKTSWLIREYGNGADAIAFKPDIDKRYTARAVLASHNHKESPAILLSLSDLPVIVNEAVRAKKSGKVTRILIDEINFFPDTIIDIVEDVLSRGIDVLASGLLTDSDRRDFGPTRKLSQMADKVLTFTALCDFKNCKNPASYTYAKKKKQAQLVVGAADMYGAVCDEHYDRLAVPSQKKTASRYARLTSLGIYPGYIPWLEDMEMPVLRKSRAEKSALPHIEVGGDSMRVGKTTALKVLAEQLERLGAEVTLSLEDWQNNPYVKASYSDSSETITNSQKWFIKRKYEQLSKVDGNTTFIQDVHPEMDYCYALSNVLMGRITLRQFESYTGEFYALPWTKVPAPDLLVYLKVSDEKLLERAQKAAREFETIDANYFLIMKVINRKWLKEAKKKYSVLEIDTDDFDFSRESDAQEKLGNLVLTRLAQKGFMPLTTSTEREWVKLVNGSWDELFAKRLVVLSGLPGSGKSYWANRLRKERGYSYLSSDVVRLTKIFQNKTKYLDSHNDYVATRELTYELLHASMLKRLQSGKKVVVDATYLGPQRDMLLSFLKKYGLIDEMLFLVVKTEEAIVHQRLLHKAKLEEGKEYKDAWARAYEWFVRRLATGEIRYPDESLDGVRVLEMWNS